VHDGSLVEAGGMTCAKGPTIYSTSKPRSCPGGASYNLLVHTLFCFRWKVLQQEKDVLVTNQFT
jgi:hypothetical protein